MRIDAHTMNRAATRTRGSTTGMTLVEVVMSFSILSIAMLSALSGIMSTHQRNQVIGMEITARNAIRGQIEEVMSVATENVVTYGQVSLALLSYYASEPFANDSIIGPGGVPAPRTRIENGRMICLFPVPNAGGSPRLVTNDSAQKSIAQNPSALGRLIFYLDETQVLPDPNAGAMWEDLGDNSDSLQSGFDMNGDGDITAPDTPITLATLRDDEQIRKIDILQLPVDLEVTFFNNASQQRPLYSISRRLIAANSYDLSALLEGQGIE